jgi:hypothetical protein
MSSGYTPLDMRASLFGPTGIRTDGFRPHATGSRPTIGQVGSPVLPGAPTIGQLVERARTASEKLSDLQNRRNAAIPLDKRVQGSRFVSAIDYANLVYRDFIKVHDANPWNPKYDQPATRSLVNYVGDLETMVNDLETKIAEAELNAGIAPPEQSGTGPGISKASMLTPTNMLVLGLLAIGSFVGAAILGSSDSGFMMAGRKR